MCDSFFPLRRTTAYSKPIIIVREAFCTKFARLFWELQKTLHQAAVYGDRGAVDVTCALGSEKCDQRCELFRLREAAGGNLRGHILNSLLAAYARVFRSQLYEFFQAFGEREAGADIIHGDAVGAEFVCEGFGEPGYAGAQRIGEQEAVDGLLYGHGGNGQEASPMIALHARQDFAGKIDIAQQGQLDGCAPIIEADFKKLFCRRAARVRDADVDAAVFLVHFCDESADGVRLGHVDGAPEYGAASGTPDFFGSAFEIGWRSRADGYFAALFREFCSDCAAQAFACGGDDCD